MFSKHNANFFNCGIITMRRGTGFWPLLQVVLNLLFGNAFIVRYISMFDILDKIKGCPLDTTPVLIAQIGNALMFKHKAICYSFHKTIIYGCPSLSRGVRQLLTCWFPAPPPLGKCLEDKELGGSCGS